MGGRRGGRRDGWIGGQEGRQGESIGFGFARVGERKTRGGVKVYEAYEVKKKRKFMRSFTSPEKYFFLYLLSLYFTGKGKTAHYSLLIYIYIHI